MLFTDSRFLLRFLPLLLALFFIAVAVTPRGWRESARRFSLANAVLLAGGIVFLITGAGAFTLVLAASVVFNYAAAWTIGWARTTRSSARRSLLPEALLTLALTGNVVLLGVYKFGVLGGDLDQFAERSFAVPRLLAPLGLTVVTCHAISYVVDVYRGQTPHQSPIRASLYLAFCPVLCAGPLVRYGEMGPQLTERRVTMAAFAYGVRRWLVGLCKVVFLANTLAVPATAVFALPAGQLGMLQAWLGAVCFALQIYFDLSGYSDMAIGLARMFGFRLPENFRWPYGAKTLTEFWQRWNISLVDWCCRYLGLVLEEATASRVSRARRLVVLFLVVGLWHGPGWNVMLWGLLHGVVVGVEQIGLGARVARLPKAMRHAYVLLVVLCLWVVFRAESPAGAVVMLRAMTGFTAASSEASLVLTPLDWTALVTASLAVVPLWPAFSRWTVTVDALTTSALILVSTISVFVWRRLSSAVLFLTGRGR